MNVTIIGWVVVAFPTRTTAWHSRVHLTLEDAIREANQYSAEQHRNSFVYPAYRGRFNKDDVVPLMVQGPTYEVRVHASL